MKISNLLKSTKITSKTFVITFEYNDVQDLKKLKALSILIGNFNPMRKELIDPNYVAYILEHEKEIGTIDSLIDDIISFIK